MNACEKFDSLRAKYLAAKSKLDEYRSELRLKYGSEYRDFWLKDGERKRSDRLQASADKVSAAFFEHLQSFSPRDWSYGVPLAWVLEDLAFEDAARPAGETLSVVPPLSYGSTRPVT